MLDENSVKKLTTLQLSASDQDSEPNELIYRVTKQPNLGHLEHATSPGSDRICVSGFGTEHYLFTGPLSSMIDHVVIIIIMPYRLQKLTRASI